jgi:hypothetical protein
VRFAIFFKRKLPMLMSLPNLHMHLNRGALEDPFNEGGEEMVDIPLQRSPSVAVGVIILSVNGNMAAKIQE